VIWRQLFDGSSRCWSCGAVDRLWDSWGWAYARHTCSAPGGAGDADGFTRNDAGYAIPRSV